MANYSTLKAAVEAVVKTNGEQAITGANMQTVLLSIINSIGGGGYIFEGVATPSTNPGTPDQNVFYLAGAGSYANFGTSVIVPPTNIAVFKYNGSWTCEQVMVENGGVFDISAFNAVGGTLATYADLADALGTNGANVPVDVRKGGMSVKFVLSTDNKYIQYRYIDNDAATNSKFTNVANWYDENIELTRLYNKGCLESGMNGVVIANRGLFLDALVKAELDEFKECFVSVFNVKESGSTKQIRLESTDDTYKVRFYGDIPEISQESTAVGYKWLPISSLTNQNHIRGRLLVNLHKLWEMTQVQYCSYTNGNSGNTCTYENCGINMLNVEHYNGDVTFTNNVLNINGTEQPLAKSSIVNINAVASKTAAYTDKATAYNDVPANLRFTGQLVTYRYETDSVNHTSEWITERYINESIVYWTTKSNWVIESPYKQHLYNDNAVRTGMNGVVTVNREVFIYSLIKAQLPIGKNYIVTVFDMISSTKQIRITSSDKTSFVARFYGSIPEIAQESTATGYKWLSLMNINNNAQEVGKILVDLHRLWEMTQIQNCSYIDNNSGNECTYENCGLNNAYIEEYIYSATIKSTQVSDSNWGKTQNSVNSDFYNLDSLYIYNALNSGTLNPVIKANHNLFIRAAKRLELVSYEDNGQYLISFFDVISTTKTIAISSVKNGSLEEVARFSGTIPELSNASTAKGQKWLDLYHYGNFNQDYPQSFAKSAFVSGRLCVDLEALYDITQVQYCSYRDGNSGNVCTYENCGIRNDKIKKLSLMPSMIAAMQSEAKGEINIGGYDVRRNGDINYDWSATQDTSFSGFTKVGHTPSIVRSFTEKAYYNILYDGQPAEMLNVYNGKLLCSYNTNIYAVELANIAAIETSSVFCTVSVQGFVIDRIYKLDWLNNNVAFISCYATNANSQKQSIIVRYDITSNNMSVVIKMPSRYTNSITSWTSRWSFSTHNNIVVYNDYGSQGSAGRIWVSEDFGNTFRCIFKMFDYSAVEETDNDFPVTPNLPWQQAVSGDPTQNGNHIHSAVYDPFYDRIWMVHGDINTPSARELGVASAIRWCDNWRDTEPTWHCQFVQDADLPGINGSKQMLCIKPLQECVLLMSDSGDEQGIFRINRTNRDVLDIDKAYIVANKFTGANYVSGMFATIDGITYIPIHGHDGDPDFPSMLLASPDGLNWDKIWTADAEHSLTVTWGALVFKLSEDYLLIKCAADNASVSNTILILNRGKYE